MSLFEIFKQNRNKTEELVPKDNTEIAETKTGNSLFDFCFESMKELSSELRISKGEEKLVVFRGLFIAAATALESVPECDKDYEVFLQENKGDFEMVDSYAKLSRGQTYKMISDAATDYRYIKMVTMDMMEPFSFEMNRGVLSGLFCSREIVKDNNINTIIDVMYGCTRDICLNTMPKDFVENMRKPELLGSDRELIIQRYLITSKAVRESGTKSKDSGLVDTKGIADDCVKKLIEEEDDFCDYIMNTFYVQINRAQLMGFLNEELQFAIKEIAFKQQGVKLTIINLLERYVWRVEQRFESYTMIRRVLEQCNCNSFEDIAVATGMLLRDSILELTYNRDRFLHAYLAYHQIVVDILKDEIKPNGLGDCKFIQFD